MLFKELLVWVIIYMTVLCTGHLLVTPTVTSFRRTEQLDIQYIDKTKDIDKLAKKINSNNDYYDFYKTFSTKEAKSKKIGTGLVLSKLLEKESVNHQEIISVDNDEYVLSISCDDAIIIQK